MLKGLFLMVAYKPFFTCGYGCWRAYVGWPTNQGKLFKHATQDREVNSTCKRIFKLSTHIVYSILNNKIFLHFYTVKNAHSRTYDWNVCYMHITTITSKFWAIECVPKKIRGGICNKRLGSKKVH